MENTIETMPFTDEATKVILQELVEKKKKLNKAEKMHRISVFSSLALGVIFLVYSYLHLANARSNQLEDVYLSLYNDQMDIVLLIVLLSSFCWLKVIKSKLDKIEVEFHLLRSEIVSKSTDYWNEEKLWENRYIVFRKMKDIYDINLFYENK